MPYLKHESGEATELRNSQILGDDSPLEFDENGYAFVEDPVAADKLLTMHRHIERGGDGPDGSDDVDEGELGEDGVEELSEPTELLPDDADSFEDGIETVRDAVAFDPSENTNDEVAELVQDVDNVEELDAIRELEVHDKNRDGALDAIDARLDELED